MVTVFHEIPINDTAPHIEETWCDCGEKIVEYDNMGRVLTIVHNRFEHMQE